MQYTSSAEAVPAWLPAFMVLIPLLVIWTAVWKGLALWHSAGRRQGWWFVALLLLNTMGILELIYLFGVLKLKWSELLPKRS